MLGIVSFLVMLLMTRGLADETVVDITSIHIIQSPNSDTLHILARPELNLPDTTMLIDKAILTTTICPAEDMVTFVSIRIHPIITEWNPENTSWDYPWANAGGDFDSVFYAEYLITNPGNQVVEIDITDLATRCADGRLPFH
jgi:hypothetical protein